MIKDQTLDEAIVEAMRFVKAAKALRAKRKSEQGVKICNGNKCYMAAPVQSKSCEHCGSPSFYGATYPDLIQHAACKRASLDLTRKLADLRAGR